MLRPSDHTVCFGLPGQQPVSEHIYGGVLFHLAVKFVLLLFMQRLMCGDTAGGDVAHDHCRIKRKLKRKTRK